MTARKVATRKPTPQSLASSKQHEYRVLQYVEALWRMEDGSKRLYRAVVCDGPGLKRDSPGTKLLCFDDGWMKSFCLPSCLVRPVPTPPRT